MENNTYSDELQHWGIKGQKWGVRRYQNKDGSLTERGQKRYNKEVEKLKKETAKVRAEEKAVATRKKTQAKLDKLESDKQKLEARKKALKDGTDNKKDDDKPTETPEQRRERVLKSTNPKEIYDNRDILTDQELMNRVNRIDLEMRLNGKIPAEPVPPSKVDIAMEKINKATSMYKTVDNAYSTVANSAIGKTIAKQLGLEPPKKEFNFGDFVKNINSKSAAEIKEAKQRVQDSKYLTDEYNKIKNKKKADDDYAKKVAEEKTAAKAREKEAKKAAKAEAKKEAQTEDDNKTAQTDKETDRTEYAKTDGKVYGEGNSKSNYKDDTNYSRNRSDDPIDVTYEEIKPSKSSTSLMERPLSSLSYSSGREYVSTSLSSIDNTSGDYSIGEKYIAGLLEYKED